MLIVPVWNKKKKKDDWLNKLWYTHETEYHAIIKNYLIGVYEHEKIFRINESEILPGMRMPSFIIRLDQVLCYILHRSLYFPYIKLITV